MEYIDDRDVLELVDETASTIDPTVTPNVISSDNEDVRPSTSTVNFPEFFQHLALVRSVTSLQNLNSALGQNEKFCLKQINSIGWSTPQMMINVQDTQSNKLLTVTHNFKRRYTEGYRNRVLVLSHTIFKDESGDSVLRASETSDNSVEISSGLCVLGSVSEIGQLCSSIVIKNSANMIVFRISKEHSTEGDSGVRERGIVDERTGTQVGKIIRKPKQLFSLNMTQTLDLRDKGLILAAANSIYIKKYAKTRNALGHGEFGIQRTKFLLGFLALLIVISVIAAILLYFHFS